MAKIYYSVEGKQGKFQVNFLDQQGQCVLWGSHYPTVYEAVNAFRTEHPVSMFLAWGTFQRRLAEVETEREKMNSWNGWVK